MRIELDLREIWIDGVFIGRLEGFHIEISEELSPEEVERIRNAEEICVTKRTPVRMPEVERIIKRYLQRVGDEAVIREIFFAGYARGYRDRAEGK